MVAARYRVRSDVVQWALRAHRSWPSTPSGDGRADDGTISAHRAGRLLSAVQVLVDREAPAGLRSTTRPRSGPASLTALLATILEEAVVLTGADSGILQLRDPDTGQLRIVTHTELDAAFLEHFSVVDDDLVVYGRAARDGVQVVVTDVITDSGYAPHRAVAAAAGIRAIQSTLLADHNGRVVGVVSTHFRRVHRLTQPDLRLLEVFADLAAELLAARLAADDTAPSRTAPSSIAGDGRPARRPVASPRASDDDMAELADYVVTRLFEVVLRLDGLRSIVGRGTADTRLAAASDQLTDIVEHVRTVLVARDEPDAMGSHRL